MTSAAANFSATTVTGSDSTPLMAQYLALKQEHPDCLLFFRVGDFYELFFDDAVIASRLLDIVLTKRGQHQGQDVPLCGVPVHAYENYLAKLIKAGQRIAVCEQMETPEEAKARAKLTKEKNIVRRAVVRIVTPATITEDGLLDASASYNLVALAEVAGTYALAALDLSEATPRVQELASDSLAAELARLEPRELLLPEKLRALPAAQAYLPVCQLFADARVQSANVEGRLTQRYGVQSLQAFGNFSRAELAALALLIDYVDGTQKNTATPLNPPVKASHQETLALDAATRRNLELTRTLNGAREGSLLAAIDSTVSAAGARQLARDMSAPLTDRAAIMKRLDLVRCFYQQHDLRQSIRHIIGGTPDLERALTRLTLGRGGPRDLLAVAAAGNSASRLRAAFAAASGVLNDGVRQMATAIPDLTRLTDRLGRAIRADAPLQARDGGLINAGFSPPLDDLLLLRDDSRRLIANLQQDYANTTGLSTLKIRHNNIFGYYIEVSPAQAEKLASQRELFIHRQTLASGVRFTTTALAELDRKVGEAAERALALELTLFAELTAEVVAASAMLRLLAQLLARLDVSTALAERAVLDNYVEPELTDGLDFVVTHARHPVVEQALRQAHGPAFVPNSCRLEEDQQLWLLTGPNMAGKSTFLRQNALLVVLAQMGSFVPAQHARLGIVDRLFSRVGAADDLARGQSTFMVEMTETAAILNQATARSLVILDEIGRGTATYDGLALAWATLEFLAEARQCRGLFATHYHELTALAAQLPTLACFTLTAKEHAGNLVFLHEVKAGTADRSYGIHVAKLAGLPRAVIARAEEILARLERTNTADQLPHAKKVLAELPLFQGAATYAAQPPAAPTATSPTLTALAQLDADNYSPKEALEQLYRLSAAARDELA